MPNIKKRFLLTGSILLAVAAMLILYVILIGTGVISGREQRLVIRAGTAEKMYDGEELVCEEWELVYGELKDGHTVVPVFSGSRSLPGQSPNRVSVRILDEGGVDVTEEYSIEYVDGILSVYSSKLTITATDAWKIYDGEPLVPQTDGWVLSYGSPMMAHELQVTLSGSLTEVGTASISVSAIVLDKEGKDITQHYEIECVSGTLTVSHREITLATGDVSKIYDGLPVEQGRVELTSGDLAQGHTLTTTFPESFSNVGTADNLFTVEITDANGKNVMKNYHVTTQTGRLEILPRELVIESATAKKIYDGYVLTDPSYQIIQGSVVDGHQLGVYVTGSQSEIGYSRNYFSVEILDDTGSDVMYNYHVYTVPGTLSVVETLQEEPVEDPTPEGDIVFYTDYEGRLYLREISFGDLIGAEWSEGTPYRDEGLFISPLFLTAQALLNGGYSPSTVYVTDYNSWCLLPSYTTHVDGWGLNTNDVAAHRFATEYYAYVIPYDYLSQGFLSVGDEYAGLEMIYGNFVRDTYLAVPEENLYTLQTFINEHGLFSDKSPATVEAVLRALRQAYTVNSQPDLCPDFVNPVEYLMSVSMEGNDYMFASAATLLYRMLGIPARLVKGYAPDTCGGGWQTIAYGDSAYWVELYVDGMGWITVDPVNYDPVTGGSGDGGSGGGPGNVPSAPSPGESGDIMGGEPMDMETPVLQLYSSVSEQVYLRLQSYGPYINQSWGMSPPFDTAACPVNPLYWVGQSLADQGMGITSLQVKWLIDSQGYLAPYYIESGLGGAVDDSFIFDGSQEYTVSYYSYDVLQTLTGLTSSLARYSPMEEAYRSYVYQYYLDIPDPAIRDTVYRHLTEARISTQSETLIADVAQYVKGAADYDLTAPDPTDGTDPIVYFLDVSKRGVCRHYASAAVMMYRALGIPARYVTGFLGTTEANSETTVTAGKAHAWVEVYIDGLGWVPVEVTGGFSGVGGSGGNGGSDGTGGDGTDDRPEELIELHIKPVDVVAEYDGNPHYATEYDVLGVLLPGHSLNCSVEGVQIDPGVSDSYVSWCQVVDANGFDVTDWYSIHPWTGTIEVLARDPDGMERPIVVIKPVDVVAGYNGLPHRPVAWEYMEGSAFIAPEHTIDCVYEGELTEPGVEKSIIQSCRIYNSATGADVTDRYRLRALPGTITVQNVELYVAIKPVDVMEEYNGEPFYATDWELVGGNLLKGHVPVCDVVGARIVPGSTMSRIEDLWIYDERTGEDVTHLYNLMVMPGSVTIAPRRISIKPVDVRGICDGTEYRAVAWEYYNSSNLLLDGHAMSCTYIGSQSDPGFTDSWIQSYQILDTRTGEDVTAYYSVECWSGSIIVSLRSDVITLVIKPVDVIEMYTGKTYRPTEWEYVQGVACGVLQPGHKLVCSYSGALTYPIINSDVEQASVSSEIVSYQVVDTATGRDVTDQYYVRTHPGKIAVKELHFTITPMDIIIPYDGKMHAATEYVAEEGTSLNGDTNWLKNQYRLLVELEGSRIDYGRDSITVKSVQVLDRNGNDVTRAFTWESKKGQIQIYAGKLAFTTGSNSKIYDGTPLLAGAYAVDDGQLLAGHRLEVVMPTITNAGKIDNIPAWKVLNAHGADVTDWYILDEKASSTGTLEIRPIELTIRAKDAQIVYFDGVSLSCQEYEILRGTIAAGDVLDVQIVGEQHTVGYSQNTIVSLTIYCAEDGRNVTKNYAITKEVGILTVLPPH